MTHADDPQDPLGELIAAARGDAPPGDLNERIQERLAYRQRLEQTIARAPQKSRRPLWVATVAAAALLGLGLLAQSLSHSSRADAPIAAEGAGKATATPTPSPSPSPAASPALNVDPCREAARAAGKDPRIDDFEDGDDAIEPLEGRAGFWRWARETDEPGTAPALIPVPRPEASRANRLALHAKGGLLSDWGATVEFNFRPGCYDASAYVGVSFKARGPGRIYIAPREVSVIPIAEGGVCEHDCHNPHVSAVDLDATWRTYQFRWSDVRQRGIARPPLNPKRLHSLAFLIHPEDTPYDVWLDDVRFMPR